MSQRKPAPPPLTAAAARRFTTKVVCSDRGQHGRTVLHHLQDQRGLGYEQDIIWAEGGRNGSPASWRAEDGAMRFEFRCPRCRRNPQLREENLLKALDALAQGDGQGHAVLDISLLRC